MSPGKAVPLSGAAAASQRAALQRAASQRARISAVEGLAGFQEAGVLTSRDLATVEGLTLLGGSQTSLTVAQEQAVQLAVGLAVRALRAGSVCLDLAASQEQWWPEEPEAAAAAAVLPWPTGDSWRHALQASPLVHTSALDPANGPEQPRPLMLVGDLLYLHRYWADEQLVAQQLKARGEINVGVAADPASAAPASAWPVSASQAPASHVSASQVTASQVTASRAAASRVAASRVTATQGGAKLLGTALDARVKVPEGHANQPNRQRLAVACATLRGLTIVAGGPGTGKTTIVAWIIEVLRGLTDGLAIALCAPTGKAATRLSEAISEQLGEQPGSALPAGQGEAWTASTIHRLLGWRGSAVRFAHDRYNPLPYDVVIVDETSMVSLPLMARLLEALRPDARLILVGDPHQLASVEAGAVLADLVANPLEGAAPGSQTAPQTGAQSALRAALESVCPREAAEDPQAVSRAVERGVVELDHTFRFDGQIADLAHAIHRGDPDLVMQVLQRPAAGQVQWLPVAQAESVEGLARGSGLPKLVRLQAEHIRQAARSGDAHSALRHLMSHRVLCAHREGPYGVARWSALVARWAGVSTGSGGGLSGVLWEPGQGLLITANDTALGLFNGDTGVVISDPANGQLVAAFARGNEIVRHPLVRLGEVDPLHAMTIHKSQGSQFAEVTVVLPEPESRILTRELLYTAVTRASDKVRLIGSAEAVRAAVERRVQRASGLRW